LIELLLALPEVLGERLEQRRALVEGEPAEVGAADASRPGEDRGVVQSVGIRVRDHLAAARVAQGEALAAAALPSACDEALQLHAIPSGSTSRPSTRYERPRNSAMRSPRWLHTVIS